MRELLDQIQYENLTHEDVWEAKRSGDGQRLTEASLGRVYYHVMKSSMKSMAIISGYRGEKTRKENQQSHKKLQQEVRSARYSFFKLKGVYRECPKGVAPPCPDEDKVTVNEPSIAILGIDKVTVLKLVRKYEQDAAVYLGPETNGEAILIRMTGSEINIGKFHPQKVAAEYSRVKGKTFVFEWVVQSFTDALTEKALTRNRSTA